MHFFTGIPWKISIFLEFLEKTTGVYILQNIKARGPGGNGCWEEKLELSKKGKKDKEGKRGKEKEEMKERKGKARE